MTQVDQAVPSSGARRSSRSRWPLWGAVAGLLGVVAGYFAVAAMLVLAAAWRRSVEGRYPDTRPGSSRTA